MATKAKTKKATKAKTPKAPKTETVNEPVKGASLRMRNSGL